MFINSDFGKKLDILQRNMDVSLIRRDVIANNIANAETPNFKRSEINFETQLKKVLEEERSPKYVLNFQEGSVAFKKGKTYTDVKPIRTLDYLTQSKNNGNNVDAEEEMMSALKNQLSYEMMIRSTNSMFNNVRTVLAR